MANAQKLTAKQEKFAQTFLETGNASEAYRQAYDVSRMSEKTVRKRACEEAQKPAVAARIEDLRDQAAERHDVSVGRIITELARVAFADISDVASFGPEGVKVKDSAGLTENQRRAIAEVSETKTQAGGTVRVKQHDKLKALELLGKWQKMFVDRNELSGPDGGPLPAAVQIYLPDNGRDDNGADAEAP